MKEKELRSGNSAARSDTTPFRPFEIHLSSGRALPVISTDHLFFVPGRCDFILVLPDGGFRIVDVSPVESVDRNDKPVADKGTGGGPGKKKGQMIRDTSFDSRLASFNTPDRIRLRYICRWRH